MRLSHFKAMQFRRHHRTCMDSLMIILIRRILEDWSSSIVLPLWWSEVIQLGCLKCIRLHGCSASDKDAIPQLHPQPAFFCILVDIIESCSTNLRIFQGFHKSQQICFQVRDPVAPFFRSCEIALDHGPEWGQLCVIVGIVSNGATWKFVSYLVWGRRSPWSQGHFGSDSAMPSRHL